MAKKIIYLIILFLTNLTFAQEFYPYSFIGDQSGIAIHYKMNKILCIDVSLSYYNLFQQNEWTLNNSNIRVFYSDAFDFTPTFGIYKKINSLEFLLQLGGNLRLIKNYSEYQINVPIIIFKKNATAYGAVISTSARYNIKKVVILANLKLYNELSDYLIYKDDKELILSIGLGYKIK